MLPNAGYAPLGFFCHGNAQSNEPTPQRMPLSMQAVLQQQQQPPSLALKIHRTESKLALNPNSESRFVSMTSRATGFEPLPKASLALPSPPSSISNASTLMDTPYHPMQRQAASPTFSRPPPPPAALAVQHHGVKPSRLSISNLCSDEDISSLGFGNEPPNESYPPNGFQIRLPEIVGSLSSPRKKENVLQLERIRASPSPVSNASSMLESAGESQAGFALNLLSSVALTQPPAKDKATHRERPRKFSCTYDGCLKTFPTQAGLKSHHVTHTGERPFPCEYPGCVKAYTTNNRLKVHMRSHTNERPYACTFPDCEYRTTQKCSLKPHMMRHLDEGTRKEMRASSVGRSIPCVHCGRVYKSQTSLEQHCWKEHGRGVGNGVVS